MAGLAKLRESRQDQLATAARALDDAARAKTLPDTERAVERVKASCDEVVKIVRILASEGETP